MIRVPEIKRAQSIRKPRMQQKSINNQPKNYHNAEVALILNSISEETSTAICLHSKKH